MKTSSASWRCRVARSTLLAFLLLAGSVAASFGVTVTWTGAGGDDSWHNKTNWSTLTVPGGADDAVINAATTVIHTNGNTTVRTLQCATAFSLIGGALTMTDGASQVAGAFAMGINTSLIASRPTATCAISNATLVDSANFAAVSGATLIVGGLIAYQKPQCNDAYWQAIGPGSRLTFPSLLNLAGNLTCGWLRLRATGGGKLELGAVTNVADTYLEALADGENSLLDLSGLRSCQQFNAYAVTEAFNGAEVRLPQLGTAGRNNFYLRPGSTMTFPALTNADGASFYALDGSVIQLPLVTNYTKPHCTDVYFTASGGGSRLKFPALVNLSGNPTCGWLRLRALDSGHVELPAATTITTSYVDLYAEGATSVMDLPLLRGYSGGNPYALIESRSGASILLPSVTSLNRVLNLAVRNGGSITLTQLLNLTASFVLADDAILNLNSVLNGGGTTIQEINGGDVLINPQVLPLTELTIRIEGNEVILEWPLDCAGCQLEESATVGPGAVWTPSGAQPQPVNGRYRVALPIGASPHFYRLAVPVP